jgi:hypothetical protein
MENQQNHVIKVDGEAYIRSCLYVEGMNGKTVIRTQERAAFVTLTGENGVIYGEVSNISEPFDFTTHVFYLPREVLSRPMRLSFQNRAKKSAYFSAERASSVRLKKLLSPTEPKTQIIRPPNKRLEREMTSLKLSALCA